MITAVPKIKAALPSVIWVCFVLYELVPAAAWAIGTSMGK
jgi:hypothetical protein